MFLVYDVDTGVVSHVVDGLRSESIAQGTVDYVTHFCYGYIVCCVVVIALCTLLTVGLQRVAL